MDERVKPASTATVTVRAAHLSGDVEVVVTLWRAYLDWANAKLSELYGVRVPTDDAIARDLATIDKYAPPDGRLLVAWDDAVGEPVGVACLKRIRHDTGEVKRMYVAPSHRGLGVGRALLDELLASARGAGYAQLLLDSVDFMNDAHRLYRAAGFVDAPPHPESEIPDELKPHWVFMRLALT